VIFVGHSFGGSVLLKYLAEGSYRKPVRGLVLVSVPNWAPRRLGLPLARILWRQSSPRASNTELPRRPPAGMFPLQLSTTVSDAAMLAVILVRARSDSPAARSSFNWVRTTMAIPS
jgi:pimeloyl-ACP methyl ester carboxylesterase